MSTQLSPRTGSAGRPVAQRPSWPHFLAVGAMLASVGALLAIAFLNGWL